MNKLFVSFVFAIGAYMPSAQATSIVKFTPIVQLSEPNMNIESITITAEGLMVIERKNQKPVQVTLQSETLSEITSLVSDLSKVEVEKKISLYVCDMMVLPFLPTLSVSKADETGALTGEFRTIYKQTTCAHAEKLYPKKATDLELAKSAVLVLKVLALETVKPENNMTLPVLPNFPF